jgi:hypothetical protein
VEENEIPTGKTKDIEENIRRVCSEERTNRKKWQKSVPKKQTQKERSVEETKKLKKLEKCFCIVCRVLVGLPLRHVPYPESRGQHLGLSSCFCFQRKRMHNHCFYEPRIFQCHK